MRNVIWILAITAGCTADVGRPPPAGHARAKELALSTCVDLPAEADAMISSPAAAQNFGALGIVRVGGQDEGLFRFDLSVVPAGVIIDQATLGLRVMGVGSDEPVRVHEATGPWDEAWVTYDNFAQQFDPTTIGTIAAAAPNAEVTVDLTALAARWAGSAQPNEGVLLETVDRKKTVFVSREGAVEAGGPVLEVCYSDYCDPNPCLNGGSCVNEPGGYQCMCPPWFAGTNCEVPVEFCGDGVCGAAEDCRNCLFDCGWCRGLYGTCTSTAQCDVGAACCYNGLSPAAQRVCRPISIDRANCGGCGIHPDPALAQPEHICDGGEAPLTAARCVDGACELIEDCHLAGCADPELYECKPNGNCQGLLGPVCGNGVCDVTWAVPPETCDAGDATDCNEDCCG